MHEDGLCSVGVCPIFLKRKRIFVNTFRTISPNFKRIKKFFKSQNEINQHINSIEKAKLNLSDEARTVELKNWLNYLKN